MAQALVENGFFPTAPSQLQMAVSIHLLQFYRTLFEQSCEAVNALSTALHTFYTERGFNVLDKKVCDCLGIPQPTDHFLGQSS